MNAHTVLSFPILPILAALPVLVAAPAARAGAPQWQLATESAITHKATIAFFTDEKNGLTAGYAGAMYFTHDGGKSWQPASNSSACRFGLEAVPGAAFTSGNQGHVRVSTDGGEHWTAAASFGRTEPNHARFLSFADPKRGLIATPTDLALTLDGGATWTRLELPEHAGLVAALSASDEGGALRLRILDENGALHESADAGKSWSAGKSPIHDAVFGSTGAPWAAMRFHGAEGVLAAFVEEDAGVHGRMYRTHDGGKTWVEEALPQGLAAGAPAFSFDGKLLTLCNGKTVRVYRLS
jgi:photosystem II stability/assembly factor-like uncharacterized protein